MAKKVEQVANAESTLEQESMSDLVRKFFGAKLKETEIAGDWDKMPKVKAMYPDIVKFIQTSRNESDATISLPQVYAIKRELDGGREPTYTIEEFQNLLSGKSSIDEKQADFLAQAKTFGVDLSRDQKRNLEDYQTTQKLRKEVLPALREALKEFDEEQKAN